MGTPEKYKVTTILGTRPEIIRLSRIIPVLDDLFKHRIVHTGQNYIASLSDIFFTEMRLRTPDAYLEIGQKTLGESLSKLFSSIETEFLENRPDAVVILGDTNSALASIIAKRMGIPVYHLEAGNRSFDQNVPEEINRRIVDHTSDFNLVYSEIARSNLMREGLHPRQVALMGSPLLEVFKFYESDIAMSEILSTLNLIPKKFILASFHRQENVDDQQRLQWIIENLIELNQTSGLEILVTLHPRTASMISSAKISVPPGIRLLEPFGFFDYCKLQISAVVTISDSGSISEEASVLGFKAVTLRNSMERPEALESGVITMSGVGRKDFVSQIMKVASQPNSHHHPSEYRISDTSLRVANYIWSTLPEYRFWTNLR